MQCGNYLCQNKLFKFNERGVSDLYRYIYVEAKVGGMISKEEHRELIDKYSFEGWRFVTAIPKCSGGYGQLKEVDLVFEKYEE